MTGEHTEQCDDERRRAHGAPRVHRRRRTTAPRADRASLPASPCCSRTPRGPSRRAERARSTGLQPKVTAWRRSARDRIGLAAQQRRQRVHDAVPLHALGKCQPLASSAQARAPHRPGRTRPATVRSGTFTATPPHSQHRTAREQPRTLAAAARAASVAAAKASAKRPAGAVKPRRESKPAATVPR